MPQPLLYYITDRRAFPGDETARRRALLVKISEAAAVGIDYIQLREKDLSALDLEGLAWEAIASSRNAQPSTQSRVSRTILIINSRVDVALATGADGVHLPANDISTIEVRKAWDRSPAGGTEGLVPATISASCHTLDEVRRAEYSGADLALFAPVFEKRGAPGTQLSGLEGLREACRSRIPVFALGGVTLENAQACVEAGAAGIAGIRLFQENNLAKLVNKLRG
jgi:thiamine-phosphate pyrophosphorylase